MNKIYLEDLDNLTTLMDRVNETPFTNFCKVTVLTTMNMRYEKIAFNHESEQEHPYIATSKIIKDSINQFKSMLELSFIEDDNINIDKKKSGVLEEKHEELWQEIWARHNEKEFQEFIDLKSMRLRVNALVQYVKDKDCVDFGSGNGSFAFALLEEGAKSVSGLDFGPESVKYSQKISKVKGLDKVAIFKGGNVKDSQYDSDSFDFAVCNGVLHHLKESDIPVALKEIARVLKSGGWFWYYVDGRGAISMDLWDQTVKILKSVDILFIEKVLKLMNIRRNKMVHIMDGSSATYLHTSYDEVTNMLSELGFHNFRRLTGATSTDFDLDVVESVPYGSEKFGTGDIRVICQLQ
jgi:ubiquinone/menaquinone biosynthesis C-methylase UbiE